MGTVLTVRTVADLCFAYMQADSVQGLRPKIPGEPHPVDVRSYRRVAHALYPPGRAFWGFNMVLSLLRIAKILVP